MFGAYSLFCFGVKVVRGVYRRFGRPLYQGKSYNYEKYGLLGKTARSWAVVTGGSDGIGLAMCQKLADEGFNICIIARDEAKVLEKIRLMKKNTSNKQVQIMYIIADFSKLDTIERYRTQIANELKNVDVAILALNAGVRWLGPFKDWSNDVVEEMVNVNVLHVTYLLKTMLP